MASQDVSHGYNPFDNSNNLMEEWYTAATAVKSRPAADAQLLRDLTRSPVFDDVADPLVDSRRGPAYYGNYQGLPNEWFYEFAKKKKDDFQGTPFFSQLCSISSQSTDHVRSIGYEIDLADTPGLGKISELPYTPDYLETIIPPAFNPDALVRDHYFEYMFADADHERGSTQAGTLNQGSWEQAIDDTKSEQKESLIEPSVDVDPVKHQSPAWPAVLRNNPFTEADSPVLRPVQPTNDKHSIDNLSFGKVSENDTDDSQTDLDDFTISTPNLFAVGQQHSTVIHADTAAHQYEFVNAAINSTTRGMLYDLVASTSRLPSDIIDNHVASHGTPLEGSPLATDEQDELEKDQVSDSFFVGTEIDESPSLHYQPLVQQQSGYIDIRKDLAKPPQAQIHRQETLQVGQVEYHDPWAGIRHCGMEYHIDLTRNSNEPEHRVILNPVSQRAKAKARNTSSQSFPELAGEVPSFIDHRQRRNRAKPPSPISTHNLATPEDFAEALKEQIAAKKRSADNSFPTRSAIIPEGGSSKASCSKKVCSDVGKTHAALENPSAVSNSGSQYDDTNVYQTLNQAPTGVKIVDITINGNHRLPSIDKGEAARRRANAEKHGVLSLAELPSFSPFDIGPYCSPGIALVTPQTTLAKLPTPLTPHPPAYPGQFRGINLCDLYALARQPMNICNAPRNPLSLTFGDRLHPNPLITHPAIPEHPSTLPIGALSYTHHTLPPQHHLHARLDTLSCTVDLSSSIPVSLHRTKSQEVLRIEVHRELAAARLEGFPVGEYRYYQGHLSVEEYIEKGMCICWSACGCSGWCSRFGDLICPCSHVLELQKEDEDEDENEELEYEESDREQ